MRHELRWAWHAARVADHPNGVTAKDFAATYGVSYGSALGWLEGAWRSGLIHRERIIGASGHWAYHYFPLSHSVPSPDRSPSDA